MRQHGARAAAVVVTGAVLASGLIAGAIGLLLVVIYSFFQYRALASVTIASLVVASVITYLTITIFSWGRLDYRLSLAGVAGLIVAIGFTVDSFIVYFERIRDELRDGKSITGAVEDGWGRAKRTIYISKSINILAAVVLYILADATVKGFAPMIREAIRTDTMPSASLSERTPITSAHSSKSKDSPSAWARARARSLSAPCCSSGKRWGGWVLRSPFWSVSEKYAGQSSSKTSCRSYLSPCGPPDRVCEESPGSCFWSAPTCPVPRLSSTWRRPSTPFRSA